MIVQQITIMELKEVTITDAVVEVDMVQQIIAVVVVEVDVV
jgi:hypothetical protein